MANSKQARKRARQADKHRRHNAGLRSMMRTAIKKVIKAVAAKDKESAHAAYSEACPKIDRIADKGIIHKNKAARHKARLNSAIRAI